MTALQKHWQRFPTYSPYGRYQYGLRDVTGAVWVLARPTSRDLPGCGWEVSLYDGCWYVAANVRTLRAARELGRTLIASTMPKYI
jgi:hypothetical protein